MAKHTSGPWSTANGFVYDAAGRAVAQIMEHYPETYVEANARLMAAAPDLLEANLACLAACVECAGNLDYDCTRPPCPQVRAAIAKARGEG